MLQGPPFQYIENRRKECCMSRGVEILEQFSLWLPPGRAEGFLTWEALFSNVINMEEEIKALRNALKKANQVAVLIGAGISAESGPLLL